MPGGTGILPVFGAGTGETPVPPAVGRVARMRPAGAEGPFCHIGVHVAKPPGIGAMPAHRDAHPGAVVVAMVARDPVVAPGGLGQRRHTAPSGARVWKPTASSGDHEGTERSPLARRSRMRREVTVVGRTRVWFACRRRRQQLPAGRSNCGGCELKKPIAAGTARWYNHRRWRLPHGHPAADDAPGVAYCGREAVQPGCQGDRREPARLPQPPPRDCHGGVS